MIWNDDDIFTTAMAREVMARGACWVTPTYIGRKVGKVAANEPRAALAYAADKLTPERLDACAAAVPWAALAYAADKLTPKRRKWCEAQP
jgi:hypothetical protein